MRVEGAIGDPVAPEADPTSDPDVAVANPVDPTAVVALPKIISPWCSSSLEPNVPYSSCHCALAGSIKVRRSIDNSLVSSAIGSGDCR